MSPTARTNHVTTSSSLSILFLSIGKRSIWFNQQDRKTLISVIVKVHSSSYIQNINLIKSAREINPNFHPHQSSSRRSLHTWGGPLLNFLADMSKAFCRALLPSGERFTASFWICKWWYKNFKWEEDAPCLPHHMTPLMHFRSVC